MVELVIKLSEEDYTDICKCAYPNDTLVGELVYQVRNNTPLPNNHMIINKDKLHCDCSWDYEDDYYTAYSMIAIEAAEIDKENKNVKID